MDREVTKIATITLKGVVWIMWLDAAPSSRSTKIGPEVAAGSVNVKGV